MKNFVNKILSVVGNPYSENTTDYDMPIIDQIKKEDKMSELNLLTKVINAITYLYRETGLSPNVIISALPNKKIYLSINVYDDKVDRYKKRILFRTTKDSAEKTLMDAVKWLVDQKKDTTNPIDELKSLIKDNGVAGIKSVYPYYGNENDL